MWNIRWQHNYGYNNRRYGNPQQHNRKPSLNLNHIHNTHTHNQFMIASHRNSISTPYLQNNQNHNQNMNNMNTNSLRAVHTTEKRPSLQETSLQVTRNLLFKIFKVDNTFHLLIQWFRFILPCSNYRKHCNVRIARRVIILWDTLPMEQTRRRNRKSILAWSPSVWEWRSKRSVDLARPNLPYMRFEICRKSRFERSF